MTFAAGIPGLGGNFFELLANLPKHVDPRAYRNTVAIGTSGGGISAILATIVLGLKRGISLCGQDAGKTFAKFRDAGVAVDALASVLASRPETFPDLVLVHGAANVDDTAAAESLHKLVPSRLLPVQNCAEHTVLAWILLQGTLPAFLAALLGPDPADGNRGAARPELPQRPDA
ncbi:MAG: hypothetical protein ABI886_13475 [Betaproteobacteria bacterium]